jgi:hypothetical protein
MALLPARHVWWFVVAALLISTLEKATAGAFYGAISSGCTALAAALIARAASRGLEPTSPARAAAYILLGISIAMTVAKLAGILPHERV